MASYVLDTAILVTIMQANNTRSAAAVRKLRDMNERFDLLSGQHDLILSVVSLAELQVIGHRNKWNYERLQKFCSDIVGDLLLIDVSESNKALLEAYMKIDLYSTNGEIKHESKNGSIKMGKNDLWIAATAMSTNSELITYDTGFRHLNGSLITAHILSQ